MPFLTDDDYSVQMRQEIGAIIGATGTTRQMAELFAQSEMESYLRNRFDTAAIFSATGADRSPIVIMYMIDIAVYHLHSKLVSRNMPKERADRFMAAKEWLKMLAHGDLNPNLPEVDASVVDPVYRFGSDYPTRARW